MRFGLDPNAPLSRGACEYNRNAEAPLTVAPADHSDLTTTRAPFIEQAHNRGQLFIHQPYELYSEANHETWCRLYARMQPRWHLYANDAFLRGVGVLGLDGTRVPRLADVNRFLCPLTGFQAKPVSGYVPAYLFFDCLRRREFPTTITIRDAENLDYLPEPDIFHDIAGHVPMHTDRAFADTLVRFGECARTAVDLASSIGDHAERLRTLSNIIRAMARLFWFTVEFGLMRSGDRLRVYGSGLLSSFGEIEHAIESSEVQRYPLQLEWAVNQAFEIHHYQPLLFVVESFEQLYETVERLERWLQEGKLNHVAPGEPAVSEHDLDSFVSAAVRME
jgi:phenylalanine-4-hydroxylase